MQSTGLPGTLLPHVSHVQNRQVLCRFPEALGYTQRVCHAVMVPGGVVTRPGPSGWEALSFHEAPGGVGGPLIPRGVLIELSSVSQSTRKDTSSPLCTTAGVP